MPLISVIIPTYNSKKTLIQCLEHIFNQTFKNIEVIIVNDGSTDNTQEELTKFKNRTQYQVKIINQENQGAPKTRNRGFAESHGEYVIFVDSDVFLKPDCLEKMLTQLKNHPEKAYTYCSFKWGFKKFKLWEFDVNKLKQMPYIHTTSLIRRECFPDSGFDPNLKRFQDWDLWLTMLTQGHEGVWVPEVLFTTQTKKNTMSSWIPAFIINHFPWLAKNKVKEYNKAKEIILKKHNL